MAAVFQKEDLGWRNPLAGNELRTVPRLVCWLAQQAAEKALKAALVCEEEDYLHTHTIWKHCVAITPARNLDSDWTSFRTSQNLPVMSPWAVEARYPGEWKEPSESDAAQAMEMARQVYDSIEAEFQRRAGTP